MGTGPLFADDAAWWLAIGGLSTGVISALAAAVALVITTRGKRDVMSAGQRLREEATAIAGYRVLVDTMRANYAEDKRIVSERLFRLEGDVSKCHEDRARMGSENAALKQTAKFLERDVRILQVQSGQSAAPTSTMPAVVTAGMDGVIIEASPSTSQLFHWTSAELVGKSVEVLIPDRYLAAHREGMGRILADGRPPVDMVTGEAKTVVGFAKDRNGDELPVVIFLTGWQDEQGKWVVSGEVVRRRGRPKPAADGR